MKRYHYILRGYVEQEHFWKNYGPNQVLASSMFTQACSSISIAAAILGFDFEVELQMKEEENLGGIGPENQQWVFKNAYKIGIVSNKQ